MAHGRWLLLQWAAGNPCTALAIKKGGLTIKTKRDVPSYWLKSAPLPTMSFAPRADLRATSLAALSRSSRALALGKYRAARRKQPWTARLRLSTTSCWPVRSEIQRSSNRCRSRRRRLSTAQLWRPCCLACMAGLVQMHGLRSITRSQSNARTSQATACGLRLRSRRNPAWTSAAYVA